MVAVCWCVCVSQCHRIVTVVYSVTWSSSQWKHVNKALLGLHGQLFLFCRNLAVWDKGHHKVINSSVWAFHGVSQTSPVQQHVRCDSQEWRHSIQLFSYLTNVSLLSQVSFECSPKSADCLLWQRLWGVWLIPQRWDQSGNTHRDKGNLERRPVESQAQTVINYVVRQEG